MRRRYEVFDAGEGVTCGLMDTLRRADPQVRFWVTEHGKSVFALGEFLCATITREDADKIAEALNRS